MAKDDAQKFELDNWVAEHVKGQGEREKEAVEPSPQAWRRSPLKRSVREPEERPAHVSKHKRGCRESAGLLFRARATSH